MDRTQKRCLVGSVVLHGTLLGLLIAGAAFAPKPEVPSVPVLELIPTDFKLTDGNTVGGGNPHAQPPPKQAATAPELPVKPIAQTPPPKLADTKPPVAKPPVEPRVEKRNEPKLKAADQPKEKAQDTDPKRTENKPKKPAIQLADRRTTRPTTTAEDDRKERETGERREREEREQRQRDAIDAANSARRQLANRLRTGADTISSGAGTSTVIEMPGPGGQAYAPYVSYLGQFYRERWKNPRASSRSQAYVGASVEVAKDGTVLDWKLLESSGVREVDDSVRDLLKRYAKLRPLPETTQDSKRLFTIQFRLDADSAL